MASPPLIAPLLFSVVILPELVTPSPPVTLEMNPKPEAAEPAPPVIAPLLVSVMIVPALDTPAPPTAGWGSHRPRRH